MINLQELPEHLTVITIIYIEIKMIFSILPVNINSGQVDPLGFLKILLATYSRLFLFRTARSAMRCRQALRSARIHLAFILLSELLLIMGLGPTDTHLSCQVNPRWFNYTDSGSTPHWIHSSFHQ